MGGDDPFQEAAGEGDSSAARDDSTARNDEAVADLEPDAVRNTFDRRTDSAAMTVVSAVAAVSNTDPKELEPLHRVIDMDALDAIFQPGSDGRVTFTYSGHEVSVRSDGTITVAPDGD